MPRSTVQPQDRAITDVRDIALIRGAVHVGFRYRKEVEWWNEITPWKNDEGTFEVQMRAALTLPVLRFQYASITAKR